MTSIGCETVVAHQGDWQGPVALDVCNLLQIAASALHLVEHRIDGEDRPLVYASLAAIRQIGRAARTRSLQVPVPLSRSASTDAGGDFGSISVLLSSNTRR